MTAAHHPDDAFSDVIKALGRLSRLDPDDPVVRLANDPIVRMAICRKRGHHLYAPSYSVREFTTTVDGRFMRRVPCTSCRVAVRVEIWDIQFDEHGNATLGTLITHYPGQDL